MNTTINTHCAKAIEHGFTLIENDILNRLASIGIKPVGVFVNYQIQNMISGLRTQRWLISVHMNDKCAIYQKESTDVNEAFNAVLREIEIELPPSHEN